MICTFCGATLKGLADARLVAVEGFTRSGAVRRDLREPACVNADACAARVSERNRADGMTPVRLREPGED